MTDSQLGILLASLAAFFTGLGAFVWRLFDRITSKAPDTQLNESIADLTAALTTLTERIARLEGKIDGIMDERERTPVNQPAPVKPRRVRDPSDPPEDEVSGDDTPPLRPKPFPRAATPARGLPYHIPPKKDR